MLTKEPGWHPDPDGGRQVRFWDGTEWTEYVQPLAPPQRTAHGPSTALADYPYLGQADLRPAREPRIVESWGDDQTVPVLAGAPRRRRSGLGWWIAGAVVALAAVLIGVITALRTGTPPLTAPSPSSTVSADASVTVGTSVTVDIPADGTGLLTATVDLPGPYLLEVRSPQDVSASLESAGQLLWLNDDRGQEFVDLIGGDWDDPAGLVWLEPGDYRVTLTEHDGVATRAEVLLYEVDAFEVLPGEAYTVSVPADGYTVLALPLESEADLVVDVRGNGSWDDPVLTYFPDDVATPIDDRTPQQAADTGSGEFDPYLESWFPAGVSFLVLTETTGAPIDVTIQITEAS